MNKPTKLTDTEEYLWSYITKNTDSITGYSISELSEAANVSNATIKESFKKKVIPVSLILNILLSYKRKISLIFLTAKKWLWIPNIPSLKIIKKLSEP